MFAKQSQSSFLAELVHPREIEQFTRPAVRPRIVPYDHSFILYPEPARVPNLRVVSIHLIYFLHHFNELHVAELERDAVRIRWIHSLPTVLNTTTATTTTTEDRKSVV